MSGKNSAVTPEPMSPRVLPNSEQVAPGRYVTTDPQGERDRYNEIRRKRREQNLRFTILDVDDINTDPE